MLPQILLLEGIELREFQPSLGFIPVLKILHYQAENFSAVTVPIIRGRYHEWDLLLHGEHRHAIGFQIWLSYNPQRLLPPPA